MVKQTAEAPALGAHKLSMECGPPFGFPFAFQCIEDGEILICDDLFYHG